MPHAPLARNAPALLAALLLFAGAALGQEDFGDPPAGLATDPPATGPAPGPAAETAEADAPDPMIARLEAARAALAAEGVVDPLPQSGPLRIAYERATLPYVRDRRAQPVRTLSGVVRVLNAGTQPVHLGPGVTLTAERQTLLPNVVPEGLRYTANDIRGDAADWASYRTVAPGEVAEFPASFVNLPGGRNDLPNELTLTVPYVVGGTVAPPETEGGPAAEVEGGTELVAELDVAAYHRGLADLEVRRTGPKDALVVFAVRGELTYLGRFALLDRMRATASEGGRRGVLLWENVARDGDGDWAPAVPPLPDAPAGPLGQPGFDPAEQARFAEFASYRSTGWPPLQAGFAEFARAVGLLGGPDDPPTEEMLGAAGELRLALREGGMALGSQGPAGDFGETLYEDATDAAAEVLASALRTLGPAEAEALIRNADPLVRPGAVRHAGPNLPPDRVPLLIELTTDASFAVRSAAASALGAFDRDDARAALAGLVRNAEDPQLAAAAAESLAVSRFPKGQTALAETLADGAEGVPSEAFAVLAEYSDPAWEGTLVALAGDETAEPDVRVAALRAVVAGRSSAADRLLADAIAGGDPVAARAAFNELAERSDPASRALAARYALSALTDAAEAGDPLDDEVADFLRETRPPAAAEPLWRLFDAGEGSPRPETIELLAALAPTAGDRASAEAVGGRLADAWERMDRAARTVTLDAVADLAPDRLPPLAGDALKSGDQSFEQAASAALDAARTDPATVDRLLIEAFQSAEDATAAIRLALTLIARATPATRAAVLEGRWDENPVRRAAADAAVTRLTLYGPAQAFFYEAGQQAMRDANEDGLVDGGVEPHRDSLKYLDIAVRLDPELAAGWSQRAFSRGQAGELEGARDDYRRALELDPYDNLAMTGLAILEIELGGDVDGGLARAEEGLKKYPEDRLFAYNMACVYGVAAKALQPAIDSGEADAETKERYERYHDKAREHLIRSYRLGLDGADHRHHASTDPDLDVLHGDPAFEQVVAGTLPPAPGEEGPGEDGDAPAQDGPPPANGPVDGNPFE
ncbi:HEAT repeat domain-containing protein [Alienimonas sp. DA493]|uniref:HEAT repeat domain-containing protein n=1 Tax=Alienimonas sp. DA493 TaxID=3373605 RepID=UPI00375417B5